MKLLSFGFVENVLTQGMFPVSLCRMELTGAVYYCRTMSTPSSQAYAINGISRKVSNFP